MKLRFKKWIAYALAVMLCAGSILTLFETAFSKGAAIDPAYDIAEGSIASSDGVALCACKEEAHRGTVTDPQIYGMLLGHNDAAHGRSGLRQRFSDVLYADNGKTACGNNMTLTLNHSVQTYSYETMLPFSKSGKDTNASTVVIENSTGRIIALVSVKAPLKTKAGETIVYDVNNVSAFDMSIADNEITLPNGYYISECASPAEPGSVFKILTSIPIIENDLQAETINDTGSITLKNDLKIQNYHATAFGAIDLKNALVNSSNVYFAGMYDSRLSSADLKQIGDRALLGQSLKLDFATLSSSFDVTTHSKYIMSSFGQILAATPTHLCSVLSGICSGSGEVMKPYLVEEITSPKGKTVEKTKQTVLTELTDKKTAETLRGYLQAVAQSYGYSGVYMKTGTAQLGDGSSCQYYCFCGNSAYTVLVSVRNIEKSTLLCKPSFEILRYTTSTMLKKEEADDAYAEPIKDGNQGFWAWFQGLFKSDEQVREKETDEKRTADQDDGFFHSLFQFFKA